MSKTSFPKKTMPELHRISIEELKNADRNNVRVVLDGIRSRNNVGAVFRTSDAFRIEKIYLCGLTPQPPHRDIFKTALGATESVPWEYHKSIEELLSSLKSEGNNSIWAVEQTHNSTPLQEVPNLRFQKNLVLIFGNEVSGVSDEALTYCEGSLEIPQWGNKHSLNISVSTGVVLWEVIRSHFLKK